MRDQIDSSMWLEHHLAFGQWVSNAFAAIGKAISGVRDSFTVLHSIEWSAPWKRGRMDWPGQA